MERGKKFDYSYATDEIPCLLLPTIAAAARWQRKIGMLLLLLLE